MYGKSNMEIYITICKIESMGIDSENSNRDSVSI